MSKLALNSLLQWRDESATPRVDRILHIDACGRDVVTIDILTDKAWIRVQELPVLELAVLSGDAVILDHDPYQLLRQSDAALESWCRRRRASWEASRSRRDRAWEVIRPIVEGRGGEIFDEHVLGPLVREAQEHGQCSKAWIYSLLRRYLQCGQVKNALLPRYDRCGARGKERRQHGRKIGRPRRASIASVQRGGINVDEHVKEYFQRGTRLFYERTHHPTLKHAYEKILERFFNKGWEMRDGTLVPVLAAPEERPTLRQYAYWYRKHWDPVQSPTAREGERDFNLRHRAILGSQADILALRAPGQLFQIDATMGDVHLVSALDRNRVIGRPVIYIIVDTYSRLITGMSVGLEGPSWLGAMLALENMTLDKGEFCREYGIYIQPDDWPSHHLPRALLADRGEMLSRHADNLADAFNIRVDNTPPYRPDWKGVVERNFRLLNDAHQSWVPGRTFGPRKRGERDCRLDACMTLREFRRFLIHCVIEHNTAHRVTDDVMDAEMITDGVEPYPRDLWLWGIHNRSGALREETRDIVRLNLLPHDYASVTRDGIHFQGLRFMCDRAQREHWCERARAKGSWRVPIAYDPRAVSAIYLCLDSAPAMEVCTLLAPDARCFEGCELEDIQDYLAVSSERRRDAEAEDLQVHAEHRAAREGIVRDAQRKTADARDGQSRAARLRGVRANRAEARTEERNAEAWLPPSLRAPVCDTGHGTGTDDDDDAYVAREAAWLRGQEAGGSAR